MDVSKVFDTLNHDLLIPKLHACGFSEESLHLIKSYLRNCWQRTKVNASFSNWTELLLGVPQFLDKGQFLDRYSLIYIYIYMY